MGIISGFIDRSVLVGGVLVGGMVPGFVAQYKQRLGGALDQVLKDLKPFQEIAKQYHNGSLEALIRHHLNSSDATFRDEGAGIAKMVETAQRLNEAMQSMQGNLLSQVKYLARRADPDMLHATWTAFTPSFSFTLEGLMVAGAGVCVIFHCQSSRQYRCRRRKYHRPHRPCRYCTGVRTAIRKQHRTADHTRNPQTRPAAPNGLPVAAVRASRPAPVNGNGGRLHCTCASAGAAASNPATPRNAGLPDSPAPNNWHTRYRPDKHSGSPCAAK
jgi:hypothetical protein